MSSYKIINTGINSPDISIAMLAYNHEKFIGKAIESVLMQKTSYTYKIIIAEDFSTDNTREIVLEYKKKYPDKIKLILQDKNVGASQNNGDLLSNLEGKYIAALEGDDYWTDPLKLQKQVDFLEENKDYGIVWAKFNKVNVNGEIIEKAIPVFDESLADVTLDNFFENYRTWTLTCVFRATVYKKYDFSTFKYLKDNTLYFAILKKAKGRVLDFNSACYRIHNSGVWSSSTNLNRCLADFHNYNEIKNKIVYTPSLDNIVKRNLNDIVLNLIGHEKCKHASINIFNDIFFSVLTELSLTKIMKFLKWYLIKFWNIYKPNLNKH